MVENKNFLPLMIDMSDKQVVIFGAGEVGQRKAELFASYTNTIIIGRNFSSVFKQLKKDNNALLIEKDISSLCNDEIVNFIKHAFLVIPATNSREINERIAVIAESLNILTNRIDSIGNLTIPSIIKRGELIISISTTGISPAFSKYVRQNIEKIITPEYERMIVLQNYMRGFLKKNITDQRERKIILWEILDDPKIWRDLAYSYEKAYKRAYVIVDEHRNKKN